MSLSDKLKFKTLEWTGDHLRVLDQTKLPEETIYLDCDTLDEVVTAIKDLKVRGAPAIGIAAAFGVVVGMHKQNFQTWKEYEERLNLVISILAGTRPTAVNLFWALDRMRNVAMKNKSDDPQKMNRILLQEAVLIHQEDKLMCEKIGEFGASLLKDGDTVLTHCNAGALATGGIGTALGIIYTASWQGKRIKVFSDETRPVLQGARLTVWELQQQEIDVTLICDNTSAFVMKNKKIDCIIVGADRVASNGDVANKIGTYNLAVLAHFHKIPFYVAAPSSSFDSAIPDGDKIKIEERSPTEVTDCFGKKTAPLETKVYSPAFDVTPVELVTAFITEKGIKRH
ncbi:MAG: methylthioribose-1-phosphate isomerase [candidate division Zixibacteria bacterium SM23_73_3]|nr:MAG: methylthioribose-1-phosphate isomerase [candidate division Zixibacteria bacterium SM23_73_3]